MSKKEKEIGVGLINKDTGKKTYIGEAQSNKMKNIAPPNFTLTTW